MAVSPGTFTGGDTPVLDPLNADQYGAASSISGAGMTDQQAMDLANFLGLPASLASDPNTLKLVLALNGYGEREAALVGMANAAAHQLEAQAAMLNAQSEAAYRAGDLALQRQKNIDAQQMAYAAELMKMGQNPTDIFKYQFARYGLRPPAGDFGNIAPLPVPDVVKSQLVTQPNAPTNPAQGLAGSTIPATTNPQLSGLVPGATQGPNAPNAPVQTAPAPPSATAGQTPGLPAGYGGSALALPPFLQNLAAQQGKPAAAVPTQQTPGYTPPNFGVPSAQSMRYWTPDQQQQFLGFQRDVAGVSPETYQGAGNALEKLNSQGAGLEIPNSFTTPPSGSQASTAEGFATGGIAFQKGKYPLVEQGIPEQITPRPDLAGMAGGMPNLHAPGGPLAALAPLFAAQAASGPQGAGGATGGMPGGMGMPGMPGPGGPPGIGAMGAGGLGGAAPPILPPLQQMLGGPLGQGASGGAMPPGAGGSAGLPPSGPPAPERPIQPTSRELGMFSTEPIAPIADVPMVKMGFSQRGPNVVKLQRALEQAGYLEFPTNMSPGYWGPLTNEAVVKFQREHGVAVPDGGWDKQSGRLLRDMIRNQGGAGTAQGPDPYSMRSPDMVGAQAG